MSASSAAQWNRFWLHHPRRWNMQDKAGVKELRAPESPWEWPGQPACAAQAEQCQAAFLQIYTEFLRVTKHWQTGRRSKCGNIPVRKLHLSEHLKTSVTASQEGGSAGSFMLHSDKIKDGAVFCQVELSTSEPSLNSCSDTSETVSAFILQDEARQMHFASSPSKPTADLLCYSANEFV